MSYKNSKVTAAQSQESHVVTEAEDCWQSLEAGRGKEEPLLQPSEGAWP
jgi:hypothetical protein